jgi:hypothetical protein
MYLAGFGILILFVTRWFCKIAYTKRNKMSLLVLTYVLIVAC